MTFFELIRSSLLADSAEKRPPDGLVQTVLRGWWERTVQNPKPPNGSSEEHSLKGLD